MLRINFKFKVFRSNVNKNTQAATLAESKSFLCNEIKMLS